MPKNNQAHQVFVKMPLRSLVAESTKATPVTSLRRSTRLLQLKNNHATPIPASKNNQVPPNSDVSPTCSSSPRSRSRSRSSSSFRKNHPEGYPKNFSKDSNESKLGPRTRDKSGCGRRVSRASANLESNVSDSPRSVSRYKGRSDCPAKSSKVANESNGGSVKCGKSASKSSRKTRLNSKFEQLRRSPRFCNQHCSPKKKKNLDRLIRSELQSPPITPFGMGEKKSRCSDLFKHSMSGSKNRIVVHSPKMKGTGRIKGKQSRSDSCEIIVCGLASSSVYLSLCGTPGGGQVRQHKLKANHEKDSKADYSCELAVTNSERMITRSASKHMIERDNSCAQLLERRSTGSSSRNAASKMTVKEKQEGNGSMMITRSAVASPSVRTEKETASQVIDGNEKEHYDCNKQVNSELGKGTKLTGNKRKRKQAGFQGINQGWTKEQEVALQRAYFAAKPSPHFWKKVAKLVPGKSAQECFDKVHSANLTPLSTRPSRAKKWNSPSGLPLSGCNLFKSPETKSKKMRRTKQKTHVARRTVRHLLQKYCHVNQDNEADLFSILEPTVNPSVEVHQLNATQSTPKHFIGSPRPSSEGYKGSSSGHKKCLSRFSSADKSPLTSPPVLKKVKNMALHEKYIDQLHKREAKRKVQSTRRVNVGSCLEDGEKNPVVPKDVIRAAKDALVSDARDAINKFRHSQVNIMNSFSDSEEEFLTIEDEDDGVGP